MRCLGRLRSWEVRPVAYTQLERGILAEPTRAGMDQARRQGKMVGGPPVTARPGFAERWAEVQPDVEAGTLTRAAAARRLGIGYATLLRLLDKSQASARAVMHAPPT